MTGLLSNAGRAALRAFLAAFLPLAIGILNAPNLNSARLMATAAVIAGLDAVLKALQVFIPQLTTGNDVLDAALRAALAAFFTLLPGIYAAPDLSTLKSASVALMVGVVAAIVRALQGLFTSGETWTGARAPDPSDSGVNRGLSIPDQAPLAYREV